MSHVSAAISLKIQPGLKWVKDRVDSGGLSTNLLVGAAVMIWVLIPYPLQAVTPLELTGWGGSLELGAQWEEQKSETSGTRLSLRRLRTEERLRLRLQGFSVDPQVLRFNLNGGFGLSQEDLTQSGQDLGGDGKLVEYDVSTLWLEQKPIRLLAFANRNQQILSREFAPRREVISKNLGTTVRLDRFLFPSGLSYRREETFQEATFAGSFTRWNRLGDKFFYQGGRRWDRMDLDLQYRWEDVDDLVHPTFGYHFQQGALFHRFLLGPDYSHDLSTTARYFKRNGPARLTFSNFYAREQATVHPTGSLTTALGFIVDRGEFKDGDLGLEEVTTTYTGFANLTHQLYESLTTRLTGDVAVTDFPVGQEERYRLRPSFNYQKQIPWKGRLLLGLDGRYEQVDRDAIGRTTAEEHEVGQQTPFSFDLTLPVATLAGLTIFNPARGITLVEGLDYLVTVAADRATVQIITTDQTRVAQGDQLLVRYRFVTLSPMRFEVRGLGAMIGFDFTWVMFSYRREVQGQRLLSGQDGTLDDITWDMASLQFRFQPGLVTLFFMNEYRHYDSDRLAYHQWHFSQRATYLLARQVTANLQAVESLTDYKVPVRDADSFDMQLYLTWWPGWEAEITPFVAYRRYEDTLAPDEWVRTVGLRGRLSWAKLELVGFAQYETRRRNGSHVDDYQVDLHLTRRF